MFQSMSKFLFLRLAFWTALCLAPLSTLAQQTAPDTPRKLTTADYARAEKFMGYNVNPLVLHTMGRPNWLPDERFWYRTTTAEGSAFILFDPARKTGEPAFDHTKVAAALSSATGRPIDAAHLPFVDFEFIADGRAILVLARGKRWQCDLGSYQCSAEKEDQDKSRNQQEKTDRFVKSYQHCKLNIIV